MDAAAPILSSVHLISSRPSTQRPFIANHDRVYYGSNLYRTPKMASALRASADDIAGIALEPAQAEISWQIVVGAVAGVAPFVVAGVEFSKRIVEQRNCKVCKGSGLVLRDNKYYFRCPGCGGFLPWQSWRRFFTGGLSSALRHEFAGADVASGRGSEEALAQAIYFSFLSFRAFWTKNALTTVHVYLVIYMYI